MQTLIIIITHTHPFKQRIKNYLELTMNILKNTQYTEEPHKTFELKKCLLSIQHHEFSNPTDIVLSQNIVDNFHDIFTY